VVQTQKEKSYSELSKLKSAIRDKANPSYTRLQQPISYLGQTNLNQRANEHVSQVRKTHSQVLKSQKEPPRDPVFVQMNYDLNQKQRGATKDTRLSANFNQLFPP